jgi:hypothetical protein
VERGFADTCAATIGADLASHGVERLRTQAPLAEAGTLPPWFGDPAFHRGHQAALIRKDPSFYGPLFPGVPEDSGLRLAGTPGRPEVTGASRVSSLAVPDVMGDIGELSERRVVKPIEP